MKYPNWAWRRFLCWLLGHQPEIIVAPPIRRGLTKCARCQQLL